MTHKEFIEQAVSIVDNTSKRHQEDYVNCYFNKIDTVYAVCKSNGNEWGEVYPELEDGKTYKVTHIGVLRSSTHIMLQGFDREYLATCFEFYEDRIPCKLNHPRFWAPYLRNSHDYDMEKKDSLYETFRKIEGDFQVKIVCAFTTGSYAYGLNEDKSDFDYIFYYIAKNPQHKERLEVVSGKRDFIGLELKNALRLIQSNNMTLLEIEATRKGNRNMPYKFNDMDIEYKTELFANKFFNVQKAKNFYFHHLIVRNQNCLNNELFSLKNFLYYLRGIVSCMWVENKKIIPPMSFWGISEWAVNENLKKIIWNLQNNKRNGIETKFGEIPHELLDFCEGKVRYFQNRVSDWQLISETELASDAHKLYADASNKYR